MHYFYLSLLTPFFAFFPFILCLVFIRRCVTEAEGQAFATKHGLLFMEMSARNAAQVEQAFIGTAERVSARVHVYLYCHC